MLARDLARLVVKIIGLVLVTYGVTSLPTAYRWFVAPDVPNRVFTALTVTVVPAMLWIVVGVAFYYGARRIVDRVLVGEDAPGPGMDVRAVEEAAIAVLGLYILATGIAEEAYYWARFDLFYRYVVSWGSYDLPAVEQTEFAGVIAGVVRVVLGLALFLLSRGIAAFRRCLLNARPMARLRQPDP